MCAELIKEKHANCPSTPTAPVVDITILAQDGDETVYLKQGVDYVIPIELELEEGETDETALDFAADDVGVLKMYQRSTKVVNNTTKDLFEYKFTFSTADDTMLLDPEERTITLKLSNADTDVLVANNVGIDLRGTLYLEDTSGNSRPCSGQDVYMPLEPSYKEKKS